MSASTSYQVLCGVGSVGNGTAMGITLNASNQFQPWLGQAGETWPVTWTNPSGTWNSLAIIFTNGTNDITLIKNGSVVGSTNTAARAFTPGPASLGAATDGSSPVNLSGAAVYKDLAHVAMWNDQLTLGQIAAVHNLFAYQYGVATI